MSKQDDRTVRVAKRPFQLDAQIIAVLQDTVLVPRLKDTAVRVGVVAIRQNPSLGKLCRQQVTRPEDWIVLIFLAAFVAALVATLVALALVVGRRALLAEDGLDE
jgi:hypothetical protein